MDNCLENSLAPSHIFDLEAFAPLYLNHKQKTYQTTTCYAGYYQQKRTELLGKQPTLVLNFIIKTADKGTGCAFQCLDKFPRSI